MCANDDVKSLIKEKISNILHEDFARVLPEYHEINTENWGPQNGYYQNEELDNIKIVSINIDEPDENNLISVHAIIDLEISADICVVMLRDFTNRVKKTHIFLKTFH